MDKRPNISKYMPSTWKTKSQELIDYCTRDDAISP